MNREYYLDLAESGLCLPIGTDLVLHEQQDAEAVLADGARLGRVIAETARRFHAPLAIPHMDLELEKQLLAEMLGIPAGDAAKFHFTRVPDRADFAALPAAAQGPLPARLQAHVDSVAYIASQTELLPIGMAIGPFSLTTKLLDDPITPIALSGLGMTADDDEGIALLEAVLELSIQTILRSLAAQVRAGARAIFIAEPAANRVYFSPNQMASGADIFERYVMVYNRQLKAFLEDHGVDLIFHCCGELTDTMVTAFTQLDPAILSLGSSRNLWEDAALVPKTTVLYGNLPSKRFYSDELITVAEVSASGQALCARMRAVRHPFILGTECDVLSVPGREKTIHEKVCAIQHCGCLATV